MEPLFFTPLLKTAIWGGSKLTRMKGMPPAEGIGESWEVSAVEGSETLVDSGSHKGESLAGLIRRYGAKLMGEKNFRRYGCDFPLLVKFIDSVRDLSIQVHPSDELAQRNGLPYGKTEMWYIVDAQPSARLVAGFNSDMNRDKCQQAVEEGTLEEKLRSHATKPGDCFFIPAGLIHSIGAGNMLVEIQQSSDCTYRVYDFNRRDANGNLRQLHLPQALEALDYSAGFDSRVRYERKPGQPVTMVRCHYFTTRLYECAGKIRADRNGADSFSILVAFRGKADMVDAGGNRFRLNAGQSVLVPACTRWVDVLPAQDCDFGFLEVYIE